jgi:predicted  nucleic acid-binding Zn-ribbon protein
MIRMYVSPDKQVDSKECSFFKTTIEKSESKPHEFGQTSNGHVGQINLADAIRNIADSITQTVTDKTMVYDNMIQQLHDKYTRGKPLSLEEQSLLEKWYAYQDTAENNTLVNSIDENRLNTLQTQVDNALAQLMTVTKRVQELTGENEVLKSEIIELRRQMIQQSTLSLAK